MPELALNKTKAIAPLKWTGSTSAAVDRYPCNAHAAWPVWATRRLVLFYIHYLLPSFCDCLRFRHPRDRGICPNCHFSTSLIRSPGVAATVRCQGNSWF